MYQFTTVLNLENFLNKEKQYGKSIAFIPTMGALHKGHVSLTELGKKHADITICSIFVNPTQFNNTQDLIKYPRTLDQDIKLLEKIDCDILFIPLADEIYPDGLDTSLKIDLGLLDKVMEGEFRPGHFKGMLQIVKRLLDIVKPNFLIMGQKDFQQFTLVKHMICNLNLPVQLLIGNTFREMDGLAMSSRNVRLTPEQRRIAPTIYQCLIEIKSSINLKPLDDLIKESLEFLSKKGFRTEYLHIVDGYSLEQVKSIENHRLIVACVALWAGDVRLIDNLILKGTLIE